MTDAMTVWTVGHSSHSYEHFLGLLKHENISAIADVRTSPYSRHLSHFNKDTLNQSLRADGVAYSFLGLELGGRPKEDQYFYEGIADYEKMARAPNFERGIERVLKGSQTYRIALMCSEHDPLDCHRCLLVARKLAEQNALVKHIYSDGRIACHNEIEERLLKLAGQEGNDLFLSRDEQLVIAYRRRARKVAYAEQSGTLPEPATAE